MDNEQFFGYWESQEWFSFTGIMTNAYIKKWTGILVTSWESRDSKGIFHLCDRKKVESGRAYIFFREGVIVNVSFTPEFSKEWFDKQVSFNNLLLLLRLFEGIANRPKTKAQAFYKKADEVSQLPNILDVSAHSLICYSLLAEDQALKDEIAFQEWPELIG